MPVRRTTGVVSCLVALSLAASAQTPVGPVVTLAPNGAAADVAIDDAGQSVVVWQADDGDQTGIFARRLDASGNPAGDAFQVNEITPGAQSAPTVAIGPGGEFVVLWTSVVGSVTRAVVRRFDAAGVPQAGDVQADVDPTQAVVPRSVAIDPSGTFLVVWDTRPGLGVSDVLARRFDATGNPLGAPFRVSSGATGNPGSAAAAPLRDGGFIVAWNRDMGGNPMYENGQLVARAFDAAGLPRGDEFPVRPDTETSVPLRAQVTAEADGGFLVTWAYDVSRDRASRAGRSFDASLAPRQAEFQVTARRWSNDGDEYEAIEQVAAGPAGGFVVVADRWTYDYDGYYINQQVNARRINGAGTLIEPEFVVAPEYPSDGPRVAANDTGDFVVVWTRNGNVRARRILWDQNTGRITGRVIDGPSGLPLPDANVRVGRFHDLTDATGAYSILLTAGSYAADVELHGYASDTVPAVVTPGGVITQDFVLRRVPILRVAGTTVDDATGNANGVADINECFALRIELSNIGAGDATAVSAMLATTTASVTVQQGVSAYPDLPPGGAAANTVAFGIKTSPTFVPGTTIQLTLSVATAQGAFTLPVSLPTAAAVKRQAFDSSGPVRVENIWAPGGSSIVRIPVTGIQGVITRVQVRIHATRREPGSMRLSLFAPSGPETRLVLFQSYASDGLGTDCPADSNDLTFQDDAASTFQHAPPPHVGEYRPWDPLARLAGTSGTAANGMWWILASDLSDDRTVIECARILITYHAARSGDCEEVAIAGTVTRADTGAPVAGASVRTDTAFQTVTDANGRYRLAVTPGPHKIAVEADGHSPGRAAVTAVVGSTVNADVALVPMVLAVDSIVVDDTGPGGNGNGRVDFDEAFRLSVRLSNTGSAESNVFAGLWPVSGGVIVTRPLSGYLELPAGGSGTNTPPFELRTTPSLSTGEPVLLMMTLVVGSGTADVPVSLETGTPSGLPTSAFTGTDVVNVSGLAGPVAKVVAQMYAEADPSYSTKLTLMGPPGVGSVGLLESTWLNTPANFGTSCPADDDDLTFDDDAPTFIRDAYWPWRGPFRPLEPLSPFTGNPGNGEWRFRIENLWNNARVVCSRLLIDTFATAGADAPDLIFRDGFDTPSSPFAPWSEVTDDPDLGTASAARVRPTPLGMRATVNDRTGLFVRHDMPGGENRYRARFHFDPNGFDPGEAGGRHRATILLAFADAPQKRLVQVVLRRLGGVYALRGVVRLDDDTLAETPFVEIADVPHVIELDWRKATDPTASDGWFELFVDGGSAGRLDGLDNDLRAVDFIRMGAMTLKDGAAGTLFFDQFEARRVLPIGPWVP